MNNQEIARSLTEIADLLDIKGENSFRIRSYRNGARTVNDLAEDLSGMVSDGKDLTVIPGIGASLAEKIREIVETGKLKFLDDLKKQLPPAFPNSSNFRGSDLRRSNYSIMKPGLTPLTALRGRREQGNSTAFPVWEKRLKLRFSGP